MEMVARAMGDPDGPVMMTTFIAAMNCVYSTARDTVGRSDFLRTNT